jgi:hypothetical protein
MTLDYVLPLRWTSDAGLPELTGYLRWLAGQASVIVVDGSPPALFERHAVAWAGLCRHVPPQPRPGRNGKVAGVLTGLALAGGDLVVLADDDVRHDTGSLRAIERMLGHADLVRPQNVFDPLPWHARWDTARSLVNRALGADYPGTFGLRRAALAGGYDGDVLFENLELIRTVHARGGHELVARGLGVRRVPPTARHFWGQRVRQAYDGFAQPARFAAELAVLPAVAVLLGCRARGLLTGVAATVTVLAAIGRLRGGGRALFGAGAPLWAPVWALERSVCAWLALGARLRGGARYAGTRLPVAAHSVRALRRS